MIIHAKECLLMINYIGYIIAIASAVIVGLALRLPLLPEKPIRQSWTISVIFPTAVLALGFTAIISELGYPLNGYQEYLVSLVIGVLTAIFSKFILERILPRPAPEKAA
jgi:energy-converting hydrogenase A subunit A